MPSPEEIIQRPDVSAMVKLINDHYKTRGQSSVGYFLAYLHLNFNSFRLAYWLVYYIMAQPEALDAVTAEINRAIDDKGEKSDRDDEIEIEVEELETMFSVLDSTIKEALRFTSSCFVFRGVKKDLIFEMDDGTKHCLRRGDLVALYSRALHLDPEIYDNPSEFKYDRFINGAFYKKGRQVKTPLIAFGPLCPAQKMAILQAKWYVINLVNQFEFCLLPGERTEPDIRYQGHEILPPTNDVRMKYRLKEHYRRVIIA